MTLQPMATSRLGLKVARREWQPCRGEARVRLLPGSESLMLVQLVGSLGCCHLHTGISAHQQKGSCLPSCCLCTGTMVRCLVDWHGM